MMQRKIVLFGGTFDPIHIGHSTVAGAAAEYVVSDKVIFIPAKRSPLKKSFPKARGDERLKMISLAIKTDERFEVSDYEIKKAEPDYTLDTVRWFQSLYGAGAVIYWLVGADTVDELPFWHKINELIDECRICVMYRAGFKPPDFSKYESSWGAERTKKLEQNVIPTPLVDISSTEIRKRLASGRDVSNMLHPGVADYIRKQGLYTE